MLGCTRVPRYPFIDSLKKGKENRTGFKPFLCSWLSGLWDSCEGADLEWFSLKPIPAFRSLMCLNPPDQSQLIWLIRTFHMIINIHHPYCGQICGENIIAISSNILVLQSSDEIMKVNFSAFQICQISWLDKLRNSWSEFHCDAEI